MAARRNAPRRWDTVYAALRAKVTTSGRSPASIRAAVFAAKVSVLPAPGPAR
ncbi:MAG TPA: hypothetical protein VGX03_14425 [Candidatus Binatia bacterium]|nr:hypothetical protein [Candidatus Binatia bacterium]